MFNSTNYSDLDAFYMIDYLNLKSAVQRRKHLAEARLRERYRLGAGSLYKCRLALGLGRDHRDHRDNWDNRDHRDNWDNRDHRDHRNNWDNRDNRDGLRVSVIPFWR